MGSRDKEVVADVNADMAAGTQLTGKGGRSNDGTTETGRCTLVSRRGFFAALAIAAGLGFMSRTEAYALAAQNFGRGQWIGNKWVNGYISGAITHPHPQRGVNDYYFGKSTNNGAWNATANGSQKLIAEFACVVECDWSDELYDHIVFRPFYYCASLSPNGHPLWFGSQDGDDNRSYIFLNGNLVGTFQGNLVNGGWGTGWLANGFYEGPGCDTFVRRQAKPHDERVLARMDIWNVWVNGVPANKNPNDIKGQRFAPNNDMSINVDKIYIENDLTLMGGIFKVIPVTAPNLRLDLIQGGYENGIPVAQYENGRGTCLWQDYDGVNQNWMFWPNKSDGLGCFTFCIANMVGPGLDRGLDNRGHTSPTMNKGNAQIWRNPESTNLTNSWWVHHEPSVTNETDHKCWFITSDADGQRLDTWGVTKDSTDCVAVSSPACPGFWATQVNAQWMIEEVACHGEVGLSSDEAKPGDSLKILGWHNKFKDETRYIRPASWVLGTKNENALPVYPIFRLYMSDRAEEITEDNAVIMASCRVATWGGQQTEAYSHRHIGWPHGGHSIFSLEMRLQDSKYKGSIHYAAQRFTGGEWDEGADGAKVCSNGDYDTEIISRVKVWLTGDIADEYDLVVRTKLLGGTCAWSDPVYVHNSKDEPLTLETAPACGPEPDGSSDTKISGMNVHLIRKPTGARVVREFSTDESLTITDDFGSGYLYVAAMLGLRLPSKNTDRIWTDRYRGTVVSKPCRIESLCVEYYADGIDEAHLVYRDSNVHSGDAYAPVEAALEAAGKKPCNLDGHFGEDAASGFTGWFKDTALVNPAVSLEIPEKGTLKLYGRNRCTLRIEYAEGSVEPDAGTVFRKKPSDMAEVVEGALGLVDFTGRNEKHRLDKIDLPAISDDGVAHAAFYRGESVTLAGSADVFTKREDGTWRRLVFQGYMPDKAGGGLPLSTIKMERDTTVYAMWAYAESDGVSSTKN